LTGASRPGAGPARATAPGLARTAPRRHQGLYGAARRLADCGHFASRARSIPEDRLGLTAPGTVRLAAVRAEYLSARLDRRTYQPPQACNKAAIWRWLTRFSAWSTTARVASLGVGTTPAASGLGRVAVDPERHGDDVGGDPQELEVFGVDAPVIVQIGDHIRRIVVDAVVIEVVDDRDGQRGVDILAGDSVSLESRLVMPVRLNRPARLVPGPEKPGRVLLVVDVRTTRPGMRSSWPVEKTPGNGGTLLCTPGRRERHRAACGRGAPCLPYTYGGSRFGSNVS
jgi:hypothetical protein